jgi:hypothetical protein
MSYQDLLYSGQLFALEKMTKERADDPPDIAEYRQSLVFFYTIYTFKCYIFIATPIMEVGKFYRAV